MVIHHGGRPPNWEPLQFPAPPRDAECISSGWCARHGKYPCPGDRRERATVVGTGVQHSRKEHAGDVQETQGTEGRDRRDGYGGEGDPSGGRGSDVQASACSGGEHLAGRDALGDALPGMRSVLGGAEDGLTAASVTCGACSRPADQHSELEMARCAAANLGHEVAQLRREAALSPKDVVETLQSLLTKTEEQDTEIAELRAVMNEGVFVGRQVVRREIYEWLRSLGAEPRSPQDLAEELLAPKRGRGQ